MIIWTPRDRNFRILSEAICKWYSYYDENPDDRSSQTLCNAAVKLFNEGFRTSEDIVTQLIGTYIGIWSTRVNALTSDSVH